jgi:hypothetical protein
LECYTPIVPSIIHDNHKSTRDRISTAIAIPIFINIAEAERAVTIERVTHVTKPQTIPHLSSIFKKRHKRSIECGCTICVILSLIVVITVFVLSMLPRSDSVIGTASKHVQEILYYLSEMRL